MDGHLYSIRTWVLFSAPHAGRRGRGGHGNRAVVASDSIKRLIHDIIYHEPSRDMLVNCTHDNVLANISS